MAHRAHLFSLKISHALRESLKISPYSRARMMQDLMAGLTVGVIAIPLSMGLAIASGVPPQYGLYTAMIAGFLTPLLGGSRFSVSGPTAAFVVIIYPVVQAYGIAGLLVASVLAGVIQLIMAALRLGRYIEYIPEPVTLGFTGGIGVVIATLQVKDFFGLHVDKLPDHYVGKVVFLFEQLPHYYGPALTVGIITLLILLVWPRLKTPVPPHLPALIISSLVAIWMGQHGSQVATIASTFSFTLPNGQIGSGIPSMMPVFQWPWLRTLQGAEKLVLDWPTMQSLLSTAFAIAMLGAIESLLCAVVLDGMTDTKHSSNSELLGQGIANIITPFFGGITATAAIARSAVNVKSGGKTPIAAMIHAVLVLLSLLFLSSFLGYLPMASLAAMLFVVAWNMSEAHKSLHLIKTAPRSDILVLVVCLSLTVLFDMVIAIAVGIVLASLLFMKRMAEMTKIHDITNDKTRTNISVPADWKVYRINGPLFFAAADRVFGELGFHCHEYKGMILDLDGVSVLDSGGINALLKFIQKCRQSGTRVYLSDFQYQPLKALVKAKFIPDEKISFTFSNVEQAISAINQCKPKTCSDSQGLTEACLSATSS